MHPLEDILRESSARHKHLCPRQVLGARMGLYAAELLGLDLPPKGKNLLVIAETDGCTVDGLIAATGCHVGGRTLRIRDFGKVAATFILTSSENAIRLVPRRESRTLAWDYAPTARNKWEAMLHGYQAIPADLLFRLQTVQLTTPLAEILSKPGKKAECDLCQEEIVNGREIVCGSLTLCGSCAGEGYYQVLDTLKPASLSLEGLEDVPGNHPSQ